MQILRAVKIFILQGIYDVEAAHPTQNSQRKKHWKKLESSGYGEVGANRGK
jgi:hypothetical protein